MQIIMAYRLLNSADVIQPGDEILNDDAETWDAEYFKDSFSDGRWFLGKSYDAGFFVPTRRRIAVNEPAQGGKDGGGNV